MGPTALYRRQAGREQGFTLMEVMIVVVIVGILASVAFPAYKAYVDRAKRTEGKAFLMELAARQERYFMDNNSYADDATELGYGSEEPESDEGHYTLDSIDEGDTGSIATSYKLVLATKAPFYDDVCGAQLTLDSKGEQGSSTGDAVCWAK
jgi:type IV pilus assembly protein PilE